MAAELGTTHNWSRQLSSFASAGTRLHKCDSGICILLINLHTSTFIILKLKTKVSDEVLGGKMDSTLDPPGRFWVELWAFYTHSPKRKSDLIVSRGGCESLLRGSDLCGEQLSDFIIIVSIQGNSQPELGFYGALFASKVVLSRLRNFMIN